jgi:hypothetical protein
MKTRSEDILKGIPVIYKNPGHEIVHYVSCKVSGPGVADRLAIYVLVFLA